MERLLYPHQRYGPVACLLVWLNDSKRENDHRRPRGKSNMKYPKRRVVSLTNNWSTHRYLSGYTCSNKLRMAVLSRAILKQIA